MNDDSWTPVWSDLIEKYGPIGALIYGRVWRYCQGERKACDAAQKTIATELKLSRRTVIRYLDRLVADGHLEMERKRYDKPNTYLVTESHRVCDRKSQLDVTESHSKKEFKTQGKKEQQLGDIMSHYEKEVGPLTPLIAEMIGEWVDDYSENWVRDAIDEAVKAGVRKPNYITAILKNWKTSGRTTRKAKETVPEIL